MTQPMCQHCGSQQVVSRGLTAKPNRPSLRCLQCKSCKKLFYSQPKGYQSRQYNSDFTSWCKDEYFLNRVVYLNRHNVTVPQIATRFEVSQMTVRRALWSQGINRAPRTFEVIDTQGNLLQVSNIRSFVDEHGLSNSFWCFLITPAWLVWKGKFVKPGAAMSCDRSHRYWEFCLSKAEKQGRTS